MIVLEIVLLFTRILSSSPRNKPWAVLNILVAQLAARVDLIREELGIGKFDKIVMVCLKVAITCPWFKICARREVSIRS